jgi:hypothetical protein
MADFLAIAAGTNRTPSAPPFPAIIVQRKMFLSLTPALFHNTAGQEIAQRPLRD